MKTDRQLQQDVLAELAGVPAVRSSVIGVVVKNGVVTVSGHIESYAGKCAVEEALHRVGGVKAIALDLDVGLSPPLRKDGDTGLAVAVKNRLKWSSPVPADEVRVTVDHGWITLEREVDWNHRLSSAERVV